MNAKRILLVAVATLMLLMPPHVSRADGYRVTYTVYRDCNTVECNLVSPPMGCVVVGEWTRECDGSWTGWGAKPDDPCTYYEVGAFEQCY